jgi:FlaG/FlaF family flagellin (archaellin)
MLLRAIHKSFLEDKRGISLVIGYVLLISISIIMSIIVYQWLKTYVPKDAIACPEGTSIFIKNTHYDCINNILNVTVKNNGKFSIDGYFIHASNVTDEEALAIIDISSRIMSGGNISGSSVRFSEVTENSLTPENSANTKTSVFNVSGYGTVYRIEIIPIRIQEADKKRRVVSCGSAKVEETLTCG